MKRIKNYLILFAFLVSALSCDNEQISTSDAALNKNAIDLAQTSGQLASGTSFVISGQ